MKFFKRNSRREVNKIVKVDRSLPVATEVCGPLGHGQVSLTDVEIIFEGSEDSFSLASGRWTDTRFNLDNEPMLLMRWNGTSNDGDHGFPYHADTAWWFPVPKIFTRVILERLKNYCDEYEKDPKALAVQLGFKLIRTNCPPN